MAGNRSAGKTAEVIKIRAEDIVQFLERKDLIATSTDGWHSIRSSDGTLEGIAQTIADAARTALWMELKHKPHTESPRQP